MDFCHLHLHTDASIIDGLGPVQRTIDHARSLGFTRLAITDHGTLANAITFTIACEKAGINPIIGEEIYIQHAGKIGHLTLLADGNEGMDNLIRLTNHIHEKSKLKRPAGTLEDIAQFSKDLVCLTGCIAAPTHWLPYPQAVSFVHDLKEIFDGHVFAEVMFIGSDDIQTRPLKLAKKLGLETVTTNDVHFALEDDARIHPILTTMKASFSYASEQLWMKTPEQIMEAASHVVGRQHAKRMIESTWALARNLRSPKLSHQPSLPSFGNDDSALLRAKCIDAASKHIKTLPKSQRRVYAERLSYELDVIDKMGYSTYFLILHDIISFAHNNGVLVGPGRGSGAASYALFLLGCTSIDPIYYNLNFERFLNLYRVGFPDVDTDFDSVGRAKVIDYALKRWNAHPIATYAHYSHKTIVHDLAKVLKLPRDLDRVAADSGPDSPEFKELCSMDDRFEQSYRALNGQIRHKGRHAGGIIVTDTLVPIERSGTELLAAWTEGDHKELTYAGVVKFDFLGLTALSALKRLHALTGKLPSEPGNDPDVFTIFQSGDTSGIFQFSGSQGIHDLTVAISPTTFTDIIAINALYRPGALDAGTAWRYPKWKKDPRKIDPRIDPILKETYGVIVFQEQLMEVYATVVNGSLAESDYARQVIVKSKRGDPEWEKSFAKIHDDFFEGGLKNDFRQKLLDKLWEEMATHARYSFNRAHSAAYGKIAWDMAWYKYHFPAHFYATMMRWDNENMQTFLFEAVSKGIKVHPPHVNISTDDYEVAKGEIYLPLSTVKFLSDRGARAVVEARKSGKFKSFADISSRVAKREVNSRAWTGLYSVDGFLNIRGEKSDCGIKDEKVLHGESAQREYMGVLLPTKKLIQLIRNKPEDVDYIGMISGSKKKESSYGPYTVFYLSPQGIFWIRDKDMTDEIQLEDGQIVSVKVNRKTGKAIEVERIS